MKTDKKPMVLVRIPMEIRDRVRPLAEKERRSLGKQMAILIEQALKENGK